MRECELGPTSAPDLAHLRRTNLEVRRPGAGYVPHHRRHLRSFTVRVCVAEQRARFIRFPRLSRECQSKTQTPHAAEGFNASTPAC